MKVKFLMDLAGGLNAYRNEILEVEDKEAERLIAAEICIQFFEEKDNKPKRKRIHTRTANG